MSLYRVLTTKGHKVIELPDRFEAGQFGFFDGRRLMKQEGLWAKYPPGGEKKYRYINQDHIRGRSAHGDLRNEFSEDYLHGVTEMYQVADQIKVPIVTMRQAKEAAQDDSNWKMSHVTGNLRPRETRGKAGVREHGNIQVVLKEAEPIDWLEFEGVTPPPPNWEKTIIEWWNRWPSYVKKELEKDGFDLGWAEKVDKGEIEWKDRPDEPPVGATADFPGVFRIWDAGKVEYGAMKPWFNEWWYWSDRNKMEGRYVIRLVSRKALERAEPKLAKELELAETRGKTLKEKALPPGKEQERARTGFFSLMMQPLDQTPYVLSEEAVEDAWIPPKGWSCIPAKWRKNVPDKFRFWEKRNKKQRVKIRDEFVKKMDIRETLKLPVKKERKFYRSVLKGSGEFQLAFLRFRGQHVIRFGPSTGSHYQLRIKYNNHRFLGLTDEDPARLEEGEQELLYDAGHTDLPFDGKWFDADAGDIIEPDPESEMNPAATKIASFEVQDKGEAKLIGEGEGWLKFEFDGDKLKGMYFLHREEPESDFWALERTETGPTKKEIDVEIMKADDEKQVVYARALIPDRTDAQGDRISKEEIYEAAWNCLIKGPPAITESHEQEIDANLVESFVYDPELAEKLNDGEWVVGIKINDLEHWKRAKERKYKGVSIGGYGRRRKSKK